MAKPGTSTKIAIKGTRAADEITVTSTGVLVNDSERSYSPTQIERGFILNGGEGDDTITGGAGPDELLGGAGSDLLIGTMEDKFDGGRGVDTLDLSGSPVAVAVDLQGTGGFASVSISASPDGFLHAVGGEWQDGVARNIENVIGSSMNDWLFGNALENFLRGGGGDDIISARSTVDNGVDQLFGEDGNDELYAGNGNDVLTGGAGSDKFVFDPENTTGDWVVMDYTPNEDTAYLFPYTGTVSWSTTEYLGALSAVASLPGGDSITFYNVADPLDIELVATNAWPGP